MVLVDHSLRHTSLDKIRFESDIPPGFKIFADPLIEKVFSNLIENSVKYGITNTYIRFGIEEHEDHVSIICEDDGVGVSPEEKEKIFSFQYGKNTGLGLFLSREILSITGISIHETGILGTGARFEITCPAGTVGTETHLQNVGSEEPGSSPAP